MYNLFSRTKGKMRLEWASGRLSCNLLLKAEWALSSDQVSQGFMQLGLKNSQGLRLHSLPWQPISLLDCPRGEDFFLVSSLNLLCFNLCHCFLFSYHTSLLSLAPCPWFSSRFWKAAISSPQSFVFSRPNKPSSLSLSTSTFKKGSFSVKVMQIQPFITQVMTPETTDEIKFKTWTWLVWYCSLNASGN